MNFEGAINSYDYPLQPVNGFTNFFYVGFTRRINYNFFEERTTGDAETSQAPNVAAHISYCCAEPAKCAWLMCESTSNG